MTAIKLEPDEEKILDILLELPPKNIVINPTPDQENFLKDTELNFKVLFIFFKHYFSEQPIPIEELQGDYRDFIAAKFDQLLALYELIQCGWKYLDESPKIPFENPGDCFIQILKNAALAQVHKCTLGRFDERPRYLNKIRRLEDKIEKGKLKQGKPGEYQKREYEIHIVRLINFGFEKFAELEALCVSICKRNAKDNKWLQKKLKRYSIESKELKKIIKRIDRNRNAYAWQKGKKLHSVREGGSYAQ